MATDVCSANGVANSEPNNEPCSKEVQEKEMTTELGHVDTDENNQNDQVNEEDDDDDDIQFLDCITKPVPEPTPAAKQASETAKDVEVGEPATKRAKVVDNQVAPPPGEVLTTVSSDEQPSVKVRKQLRPGFEFGPYVPIVKVGDKIVIDRHNVVNDYHKSGRRAISTRLVGEILPDDSIVEAPSLTTPILLKKKTYWPPREASKPEKPSENGTTSTGTPAATDPDEDIKVVKVVGRSDTPDIVNEINSRYRKPEEYIQTSVVASLTSGSKSNSSADPVKSILAIDDYIKSSVGELLFGIGLSRVMEFSLEEKVRKLDHKVRKGDNQLVLELANTKMELVHAKQCNIQYKPKNIFTCHICSFKSEFASVLDHHLDTPHKLTARVFQCNWCDFKTKDSTQILYHNHIVHRKSRCRLGRPFQAHCCHYCEFETSSLKRFRTHITKCEQMFDKYFNLAPDEPDDYPAVTPKPITQQDVRVYESTLKALRLAAYNPHQIKVSSPAMGPNGCPILLLPKSTTVAATLSSQVRQITTTLPVSEAAAPYNNPNALIGRGSAGMERSLESTLNQQTTSPNLLRLLVSNSTSNSLPNNRSTILQHPRAQSPFVNGMSVVRATQAGVVMPPTSQAAQQQHQQQQKGMTTATGTFQITDSVVWGVPVATVDSGDSIVEQSPSSKANANPNGTFVICEICDAYIENSSSFKSHMQWVHKVKIHQKVLDSRKPPLNCQKCNWRYFTDQGLERHLLGSHGLVTSNMQVLADNERDSGRCTICGVRCPKKLVSHMRDVHKVNLKPAQLSYKCTVCSATFSLYRHFENHVYRVHRNTVRQASGDKEPVQENNKSEVAVEEPVKPVE